MQKFDLVVLGAGPAGIMTALIAKKRGKNVLLLEKNERIGKKILSTGNGRCNLTNEDLSVEHYFTDDPEKLSRILDVFGKEELLAFMDDIGVLTCQKNGYYYPNSMQASTVRDALETACRLLNITVKCGCHIKDIKYLSDNQYNVITKEDTYLADSIVFAFGGLAAPKLGSDGSGFDFLWEMDLKSDAFVPALVPLTASDNFCKKLAGVRADGLVKLLVDGEEIAEERGEIQFTEYGISGIPTFQLSRLATFALREKKKVEMLVDFLPDYEEDALLENMMHRKADFTSIHYGSGSFGDLANGFVNNKIAGTLAELCKIDFSDKAPVVSTAKYQAFTKLLKGLTFHINGSKGFDAAQVSAGGVKLKGLTDHMECKKIPGCYVVGETVNVDGICGGYNLQWAFSSGYMAGSAIAEK